MLKRDNFHILCLFYVLARLMNGLEVVNIEPFWAVQHGPELYKQYNISLEMESKLLKLIGDWSLIFILVNTVSISI